MLARVAIDLALDRLFTYEVPAELEKKLAVGQLLSVPFGHRTARGFVMELERGNGTTGTAETDGTDEDSRSALRDSNLSLKGPRRPYSLKPIGSIVDEEPFFSTRLLELVRALAAYTAAPVESVLKADRKSVV